MISHLGPQLGVANGIALSNLLKIKNKVTAVFTGEGGTSEGDFHEALNVAAVTMQNMDVELNELRAAVKASGEASMQLGEKRK